MASWPPLAGDIEVLPGTDVADAWDRFEVFEALHHPLQICNPMTSTQLDEAVDVLAVSPDRHIVDYGCGYGELLMRASAAGSISGTGVDLSPWMITTAHARSIARVPDHNLHWVLGDASTYVAEHKPDVAVCIGAEWVWHDFAGTARALSQHLDAADGGGVAVIGAARLHRDADADAVRVTHGRIETVDDQWQTLERCGLQPFHRIDPDDAAWDAYLDATKVAATQWVEAHPGERAERWLAEQADWVQARERDRNVIGWSVWFADNPSN